MVDTQERVDVIHGLCADIGEFLDLGCGVLDLCRTGQASTCIPGREDWPYLVVSELEAELFDTALDSVPASEPVTAMVIRW